VADARSRVQPAPQHVTLGDVGRKKGADEGGGEESVARLGHWMISSACKSNDGGMARPKAFAVLRLIKK
jgi:hypothetical protein